MAVPYQPQVPQRFESTHIVTIKKVEGQWRLDFPAVQRQPGDSLQWKLVGIEDNPNVEAHFQFPPDLLLDPGGNMIEYRTLNQKNPTLDAEVIQNRALKSTDPYYYAIFIDGDYVKGHNPPPEIIVGP